MGISRKSARDEAGGGARTEAGGHGPDFQRCLDEDEIAAFSSGTSSGEEVERLERHVDDCPRCLAWIAMMAKVPAPALGATLKLDADEPLAPPPAPLPPHNPHHNRLGRYELICELGAGAMGVVYRAYDTVLRRAVALKLIRTGDGCVPGSSAEHRLLAEAHALARVAHPNVVSIYDVGLVDGQLFIALELIDGVTLSAWQVGRGWRDIVSCYLAAARGLAAVHHHGLVHRDFKPDNVLVAGDRVVVSDFGLACILDQASHGSPRARVGTPAYMAPEQFRGEPSDRRSDVFNVCASLYHSLHGQPAFDGDTLTARAEAVLDGRARADSRAAVPRWLKAVLRQGLATDPADRPQTIDALIHLLQHDQRWRRRRHWLMTVAASLVILILGASLVRERMPLYHCQEKAAAASGGWSRARRAAVQGAFAESGASFATHAWQKVDGLLAAYHHALGASYRQACDATYRDRTQGATTFDLRIACLESRLREATTLEELLAVRGGEQVRSAVAAATQLWPVAPCDNVETLTAPLPPPLDGPARAAMKRAQDALASGTAARLIADDERAARELAIAAAEANRSGHLPTQAAVEIERALLSRDRGEYATAARVYEHAYALGERGRDDTIRMIAARDLVNVVGFRLSKLAEGERWAQQGENILARLGQPDVEAAELLMSRGMMLLGAQRLEEAEPVLRQSLELRERLWGQEHYLVAASMNNLAAVLRQRRKYAEATVMMQRAYDISVAALGQSHPRSASILGDLGNLQGDRGHLREARRLTERSIALLPSAGAKVALRRRNLAEFLGDLGYYRQAIDEARHAAALYRDAKQDLEVALTEVLIARQLGRLGELQSALPLARSALLSVSKELGEDHASTIETGAIVAELEEREGLHDEALARVEALLTRARTRHANPTLIANLLDLSGRALRSRRRTAEALAAHREALALRLPDEPLASARSSTQLGLAALAAGQEAEAVAALERALALQTRHDANPEELAETSFALAMALHGHTNAARASSLATSARRIYLELGAGGAAQLASVDRWLTAHSNLKWRIP